MPNCHNLRQFNFWLIKFQSDNKRTLAQHASLVTFISTVVRMPWTVIICHIIRYYLRTIDKHQRQFDIIVIENHESFKLPLFSSLYRINRHIASKEEAIKLSIFMREHSRFIQEPILNECDRIMMELWDSKGFWMLNRVSEKKKNVF